MSRPKWNIIHDIDSELVLCFSRVVDSDYPAYLFVRLTYLEEYSDEFKEKYCVSLLSSSPGFARENPRNIESTRESYGMTKEDFESLDPIQQAWLLAEYGLAANLFEKLGNNKRHLLKEAKQEGLQASVLFGFYVDRQQNAIGATGWDFMRGDIVPNFCG